jgi:hypothetical protein
VTRLLAATAIVLVCAVLLAAQDADLPDGDGRRILIASCTSCHDLKEVTKLRGYYSKEQWRDVVKTMIEYGADVKKQDEDVLVDYLAQHLGKKN